MTAHLTPKLALILCVVLFVCGGLAEPADAFQPSYLHSCLVMRHQPDGSLPNEIDDDSLIVLDYGSFVLARLYSGTIERLRESGESVELIDDNPLLKIAGFSFDPLDGLPELPRGLELQAEAREAPQYAVVQWIGPIRQDFVSSVEALGAKCIQYIPDYAMLVRLGSAQLESVSRAEFVRSVTPFEPAFKVERVLRKPIGSQVLRILLDRAPDIDPVVEQLRVFGEIISGPVFTASRAILHLSCDTTCVPEIAAIPEVLAVGLYTPPEKEDGVQDQVMAMRLDGNGLPVPGYRQFLEDVGVSGDGVVVAVCDTGLDTGTDLEAMHLDLRGRVHGIIDYANNSGRDYDGHGTHCAGIVAGDNGSGVVDENGFEVGLGVAPKALIVGQNYLEVWGSYTMTEILGDAYSADAVVHSNSWGDGWYAEKGYTLSCIEWDTAALDVQPDEPGTQRMIIVKSAGNEDYAGLSSPAESKNTIAVGATQNYRPEKSCTDPNGLADFSSRGLCEDGRIKPDLCAPGECIVSALSSKSYPGWCYGSFGSFHEYCSGTSMSCPAVAGAAALMVQKAREETGNDPSPELVRAWMIATAVDMPEKDPIAIPNRDEGWGRVDLSSMLEPEAARLLVDGEVEFSESGEDYTMTVSVESPDRPLKVVLAWMDPPGYLHASPALVNDLDLVVTASDGTEYWGNNFSSGMSSPGAAADRLNNVECVFIDSPASQYEVRVVAHQVSSDATPASGGIQQPFSLFLDNALDISSKGWISFSDKVYSCSDVVEVTVADVDLAGEGSATVWAVCSSADEDWIAVSLWPTLDHPGVFSGTFSLSPYTSGLAQDGLHAQHGDFIAALYIDADDGRGHQGVQTWCFTQTDCAGPVLQDFQVKHNKSGEVEIRVEADEHCSAKLEYWDTSGVKGYVRSTLSSAKIHQMSIQDLYPCSTYWCCLYLTDALGNLSIWDNDGASYQFETTFFDERTETGGEIGYDDGWFSSASNGEEWHRSTLKPYYGLRSWYCGNESSGHYGNDWNTELVSEKFPVAEGAELVFMCWYDTESTYDYLKVYVRTDSKDEQLPGLSFSGKCTSWLRQETSLEKYIGETVRIVFRFTSDTYTTHEGCYIDECAVISSGDCRKGILLTDAETYACSETVQISLLDIDLSQDDSSAESVIIELTRRPDDVTTTVTLTEVAESSPRFSGEVHLSPDGVGNTILVSHNNSLTFTYVDPYPTGSTEGPETITVWTDCQAPIVTEYEERFPSDDEVVIDWSTDTPSRALFTLVDCDDLVEVRQDDSSYTRSHEVVVSGLAPCTQYRYYVELWDEVGNYRMVDADGRYLEFETLMRRVAIEDDCEHGEGDWRHYATRGQDQWHLSTRRQASGSYSWFCGLESGYYGDSMTCILQLDSLQWLPSSTLTFQTLYALESGYDYGYIEVQEAGNTNWDVLREVNGFSNGWKEISIELPDFDGPSALRFRMYTDTYDHYEGWYIDDMRVEGLWNCHSATLELDKSEVGCTGSELGVQVVDMDLNTDPKAIETAEITVSSAITGDSITAELREIDTNSSTFTATVYVTDEEAPGSEDTVRSADTDSLSISYLDEMYGADRTPLLLLKKVVADCVRPEVLGFRVVNVGAMHTLAVWDVSKMAECVLYYESYDSGDRGVRAAAGPKQHFSVSLEDLRPCETYRFSLDVLDTAGNSVYVDPCTEQYEFRAGWPLVEYSTSFSNRDGWTHTSLKEVYRPEEDVWEWTAAGGADEGPECFAASIPAYTPSVDAVLVSPPVWAEGAMTVRFLERHSSSSVKLAVEAAALPDGDWVDITPYAITSHSGGEYSEVVTAFATSAEQCRFRLRLTCGLASRSEYMYIDDFEVVNEVGCEPALRLFCSARELRVNSSLSIALRAFPANLSGQFSLLASLVSQDGSEFYYPDWSTAPGASPLEFAAGEVVIVPILEVRINSSRDAQALQGHWYAKAKVVDETDAEIASATEKGFRISADIDRPPCASLAASPAIASVGQPVMFDASGSFDDFTAPESLLYRWDLGADGTWDSDFGQSPVLEMSFDYTTAFEVAVEVMDSAGQTETATQGIYVL